MSQRVAGVIAWALRPSRFALVGMAGIVVNQVALWAAVELLGLHYLIAALVATQFSTAFNFTLTELWVFAGRQPRRGLLTRYVSFLGLNLASSFAIRLPILFVTGDVLGVHYLIGNLLAYGVSFAVRYLIADTWIWAGRDREGQAQVGGWYHYNLHGLIGLRSEVELPELAAFNDGRPVESVDLEVRRRLFLGGGPRLTTSAVRDGSRIRYREMLGALSAAFDIDERDGTATIEANWLLCWSNHVLYTNMVEPMLRFMFARRGLFLLHGASIEAGGGVVLSARTDTGKTSTILRLLASGSADFLGDDMVILGPDGRMLAYPKPLTLSSHTMSSVPAGAKLGIADRVMLEIRSRLHSRGGRAAGHFLSRLPLPIVTMSAWVQALIPPPKYHISSLLSCVARDESQLREVVLIERGPELTAEPPLDELVDELIVNTDDAYTFPPFASIAPLIEIDGVSADALRQREREIVTAALANAKRTHLRLDDFSWAERLGARFRDALATDELDRRLAA